MTPPMSSPKPQMPPPADQPQRERALDPARSVLVQAPAGSGKTDLLTRRYLRLLTEVEDPAQIVAITFTKAAAAEMRHRILSKLEDAAMKGTGFSPYIEPPKEEGASAPEAALTDSDPFSMDSLARRALTHSQSLGWNLLDQPAQLRISTIDSFCRDIALQQPLLSGLGDGLGIYDQPEELYRRAARQALQQIDGPDHALRAAIESLLLWRDNNWAEMETLLIEMLQNRDRWMHGFVLEHEQDWEALRHTLERPFAKAIQTSLTGLGQLLDQVSGARDEALALARFACQQGAAALFQPLAELPELPADLLGFSSMEEAQSAYLCLANLFLTLGGDFRKAVDKRLGFPSDRKQEKAQLLDLIARIASIPGLESALAAVRALPPVRYSEDDWQIIRACFTLLRNAAAQLRVVFAEAGAVDYIEVAQIALSVLTATDGHPTDVAINLADSIHHLLVDEFQDTSRRQHELLRRLIAAWPDREGRSCFVVGDPMQSIYFFRDADAELFPRVREAGLEVPASDPLLFDPAALTSNFRTVRPLVTHLNQIFSQVFAANDGSGVTFSPATPARNESESTSGPLSRDIYFSNQNMMLSTSIQTNKTPYTQSVGVQEASEPRPNVHFSEFLNSRLTNHLQTNDNKQVDVPHTPQISAQGLLPNPEQSGSATFNVSNTQQTFENKATYELLMNENATTELSMRSNSLSFFTLHINFGQTNKTKQDVYQYAEPCFPSPQQSSVSNIIELIRSHFGRLQQARAAGEKYRLAVLGRTRNVLAPIALALRQAGIPYRAVDLEKLSARPEILDALALAQALLNPLNRVAWLGLLRAPWCGLSLADLHTLTSADSTNLLARPIPDLLAERIALLTPDGRLAAQRLLDVLAAVPALRFAQPTATLGAWLQQVWLRLGGAQCVTPTERANLDLLWQKLDTLPNGEQDLLGPALDSTLQALTAQPDPGVSSDCGVQLMTIHKSKGLEFEVVIVPDLQAGSSHGKLKMLSWLERGLPPGDPDAEIEDDGDPQITEFLVAPLQSKGADRNSTKLWVDRVYRERESQEMRRLLYVAATRARNELHLFAQPVCKQDKSGAWTLSDPKDSLLKTAWPALEEDIQTRFAQWVAAQPQPTSESAAGQEEELASLAASADTNLLVMPAPARPIILRRLPPHLGAPGPSPLGTWDLSAAELETRDTTEFQSMPASSQQGDSLYQRHRGGLISRALGTAVHAFLEHLALLRKSKTWDTARATLKNHHPDITAKIRATGLAPTQAAALADEALNLALAASRDPLGNWILSPHADDATELRWTGLVSGQLRTVQVDRLFRAGLQPLTEGTAAWWIVDYKTAQANLPDPATALPELRAAFAPQLRAYADILRKLHGPAANIRAALYYPRMSLLDWLEI